ncbi:MAG: TIGR04283 family arsenosugar biosynthesis glycosyltransferase [Myxococcota bacterium]
MGARPQVTVSVIIPTLNEEAHLESALRSVGVDDATECIVVDAGSTDATCELAEGWPGIKLIRGISAGRGAQMNAGARAAAGDVLLFLHADCQLPRGGIDVLRRVFADQRVVGGSFCLGFVERHWVLQLLNLGSRINHPLTTYGDQAQFARATTFHAVEGFPEWPLMEDLEIQFRLREHGRLTKIRRPVVCSDRRFHRRGPVRHQLFNTALVGLYLLGVPPTQLGEWYRPQTHTG